MPTLPTVAIIGRPNTGKSTLFNRMIGRRQAIVSELPGTTRDHVAGVIRDAEIPFLLIDTGGMGGGSGDKTMEGDVHAQSLLAIEHADIILFTVNSREELTSSDFEITSILRKRLRKHIPVIVVVTKCDNQDEIENLLPAYHALGIADDIIAVSALHTIGIEDLRERIAQYLVSLHFQPIIEEAVSETPRIAIIGQPNVGKSSFVNGLMSDQERSRSPKLVSEIPGTTRDATDTVIRHDGNEFIFVDTAGLRKAARKGEELEGFSVLRTIQALQHTDITLLILDAKKPVSKQDKRIARMAMEEGKGLIVAVNKSDLLTAEKKKEKTDEVRLQLQFCRFAPILFCSAKTREGLLKAFGLIAMVQRNRIRRIGTKDLHRWFSDLAGEGLTGKISKTKHITQADELPPTFVLFVPDPKKVQLTQLKFLDRKLRETFGFEGTPVRWVTKRNHPALARLRG